MVSPEPFWLDSPSILLTNLELVPNCDMTKEERLNAITRLILIVSLVLFIFVKSTLWLTVLVSGLVVVLVIYFFNVKRRQGFQNSGSRSVIPTHVPRPLLPPLPLQPQPPILPPKQFRTGSVGFETRTKPVNTICNMYNIKPTVTFRKR